MAHLADLPNARPVTSGGLPMIPQGVGAPPPPGMDPKRGKLMCIKVRMLDDSVGVFHLGHKALGQALFDEVCRHLNLLEGDYFGLEFLDCYGSHVWLDKDKPILRQITSSQSDARFYFIVKFYTPNPADLEEEYTRYLFACQIKRDLATGEFVCNDNTAALMASYVVQSECGDYSQEDYPDHTYLSATRFVPNQNNDFQRKVMDNHRKLIGMSPAEADLALLETARRCDYYGVKFHVAKDIEGTPVNLSVAHMGMRVFHQLQCVSTFSWAKVRKLSFKRKKLLVKLHPESYQYYKETVEFVFETRNECKSFWKKCVEHHAFFRCVDSEAAIRPKDGKLFSKGSSFRYQGRTQKQLIDYVREHHKRREPFTRPIRPSFAGGTQSARFSRPAPFGHAVLGYGSASERSLPAPMLPIESSQSEANYRNGRVNHQQMANNNNTRQTQSTVSVSPPPRGSTTGGTTNNRHRSQPTSPKQQTISFHLPINGGSQGSYDLGRATTGEFPTGHHKANTGFSHPTETTTTTNNININNNNNNNGNSSAVMSVSLPDVGKQMALAPEVSDDREPVCHCPKATSGENFFSHDPNTLANYPGYQVYGQHEDNISQDSYQLDDTSDVQSPVCTSAPAMVGVGLISSPTVISTQTETVQVTTARPVPVSTAATVSATNIVDNPVYFTKVQHTSNVAAVSYQPVPAAGALLQVTSKMLADDQPGYAQVRAIDQEEPLTYGAVKPLPGKVLTKQQQPKVVTEVNSAAAKRPKPTVPPKPKHLTKPRVPQPPPPSEEFVVKFSAPKILPKPVVTNVPKPISLTPDSNQVPSNLSMSMPSASKLSAEKVPSLPLLSASKPRPPLVSVQSEDQPELQECHLFNTEIPYVLTMKHVAKREAVGSPSHLPITPFSTFKEPQGTRTINDDIATTAAQPPADTTQSRGRPHSKSPDTVHKTSHRRKSLDFVPRKRLPSPGNFSSQDHSVSPTTPESGNIMEYLLRKRSLSHERSSKAAKRTTERRRTQPVRFSMALTSAREADDADDEPLVSRQKFSSSQPELLPLDLGLCDSDKDEDGNCSPAERRSLNEGMDVLEQVDSTMVRSASSLDSHSEHSLGGSVSLPPPPPPLQSERVVRAFPVSSNVTLSTTTVLDTMRTLVSEDSSRASASSDCAVGPTLAGADPRYIDDSASSNGNGCSTPTGEVVTTTTLIIQSTDATSPGFIRSSRTDDGVLWTDF